MGVKIVAVSDVMELHYTTITPQLFLNGTALKHKLKTQNAKNKMHQQRQCRTGRGVLLANLIVFVSRTPASFMNEGGSICTDAGKISSEDHLHRLIVIGYVLCSSKLSSTVKKEKERKREIVLVLSFSRN